MDGRVTVGGDFFRRRVEHAVSTASTIIFLGLIYGRALWLTLFSPRGSAPGRSFSRRAASSSQSERDSLPPAAWLVVAMDHFLSPTACSLPIRASLSDRPYSRVVTTITRDGLELTLKLHHWLPHPVLSVLHACRACAYATLCGRVAIPFSSLFFNN